MAKLGTYVVGDQPQFSITCLAAGTTLTDPTVLKVVVRISATETVYTYGVDAQVTRTSLGVYTLTLPQLAAAVAASEIYVRVNATGTVTASDEDYIVVNRTAYTTPLP